MIFSEDLKAFLTANGYSDIYRDTMPDLPDECIGLLVWGHKVPEITTGGCWRFVQIQVRRVDGDNAYADAFALHLLLDSGRDETPIQLTEGRSCVVRPRSGPRKLSDDGKRVVYYIEAAFGGKNDP